jgi:hypothetical protein
MEEVGVLVVWHVRSKFCIDQCRRAVLGGAPPVVAVALMESAAKSCPTRVESFSTGMRRTFGIDSGPDPTLTDCAQNFEVEEKR